MKTSLVFFLGVFTVAATGCATNSFKKYYSDQTGGRDLSKQTGVIMPDGSPQLVMGSNPDSDSQHMEENGFRMLGSSSFYGPSGQEQDAVKQGQDVHAAVVIVYSKYKDTFSEVKRVTTHNTQVSQTNVNATGNASVVGSGGYAFVNDNTNASATTVTQGVTAHYVPHNVSRNDYFASYWIKLKPPVFGLNVIDLTDEQRRSIASNKGVAVKAVAKDSPAFRADLMRDDIIKKIGGEEVTGIQSYRDLVTKSEGKTVIIEYVRDGKIYTKEIQLNRTGM